MPYKNLPPRIRSRRPHLTDRVMNGLVALADGRRSRTGSSGPVADSIKEAKEWVRRTQEWREYTGQT